MNEIATVLILAVGLILFVAWACWEISIFWLILRLPFDLVKSLIWWRRERAERRSDAALAAMQSDVQK